MRKFLAKKIMGGQARHVPRSKCVYIFEFFFLVQNIFCEMQKFWENGENFNAKKFCSKQNEGKYFANICQKNFAKMRKILENYEQIARPS